MYDMHKELNEFYEDHVRLKDGKKKLREHRDTNITALKDGLKKLKYPFSFENKDQGSYAMNTINKHPDKDYDIDEAIIFEKVDLPSKPADARKRIEEAMIEGGGDFKTPPEAKTNAVRVSYTEGHHVDLAIYRKYEDFLGNPIVEHAGAEWTTRDPIDITNWFSSLVQEKSPSKSTGAKVDDGQVRRIVRWLKMFAKSRSSWDGTMPGGLIISALVEECYIPNQYRDDSSLYDTMVAIRNRLKTNQQVLNPVDKTQYLTSRDKDVNRVKKLEENLNFVLEKLDALFDIDCQRSDALRAWNWVFKHSYWAQEADKSSNESGMKKDGPVIVKTMPGPWMKVKK